MSMRNTEDIILIVCYIKFLCMYTKMIWLIFE